VQTSRRAFFGQIAAALAGATLDPERLLWRPDAKTIFLPPAQAFSAYDGSFDAYVRAAASALADEWDRKAALFAAGEGQRFLGVTYQPIDGILRESDAALAGRHLSASARSFGMVSIDAPEIPKSIERALVVRHRGVALRGVQAYDPVEDQVFTRLDVVGRA
jgi:hypothetical protein